MRWLRTQILRLFPQLGHWCELGAFSSLAAFSAGIAVAALFPLHSALFHELLYPVCLTGAIAAIAAGVVCNGKRIRFAAFMAGGVFIYTAQAATGNELDSCIGKLSGTPRRIEGDVIVPPAPKGDRVVFLFRVRSVAGDDRGKLRGKVFVVNAAVLPVDAGRVTLDGVVATAQHRRNRYDFDEAAFFRSGALAGRISAVRIEAVAPPAGWVDRCSAAFRTRLLGVLKYYHNPDHRALMRASFTGEKAYIAPEVNTVFQRSGLYHLLALSGFNAAIMLAAVYVLLAPFPLKVTVKHLVAIGVLWLYNGFVGPIPSLMRAVIMATVVIAALMFQRKNYPLQTFGIAGIVWLLFSPSSLFQPGFQLSYGATFGIMTLNPLFMRCFKGLRHPLADAAARPLVGAMSVSLAAFIVTLPILLYHFGTVSLYGLAANIVAIPLMSASMWAFFSALIVTPFCAAAGGFAVAVSGWFMATLLAVAGWSMKIPFCMVSTWAPFPELIVAFYLLIIAMLAVERRHVGRVLAWGVPILACMAPAGYLARIAAAPTADIIRFSTTSDATVTAERKPGGTLWLFCSGKETAVRRAFNREVAAWMRHEPGTAVGRIVTVTRDGIIADSTVDGKKREYRGSAAITLHSPGASCSCRFTRAGGLEVASGGSVLYSGNTVGAAGVIRNGAMVDTLAAPFEVALRNGAFVERQWRFQDGKCNFRRTR